MTFIRCLMAVTLFVGITFSALAQERAAGSSLENQMTWTALQNQIAGAQTYAKALSDKLDQAIACGNLGKLYAPGAAGADTMGCKFPIVDLSTNTDIINIKNSLNNITLNVDKSVNYNIEEQKCSKQGYVYSPKAVGADANGCLKPVPGKSCIMNKVEACGSVNNCKIAARTPFKQSGGNYVYTNVPTAWKHGDTYIWHWDSTNNDYGGGQCNDGVITYFTTGK